MDNPQTYQIKSDEIYDSAKCQSCQHTRAAHGLKGSVCCQCSCIQFMKEFDPKRPMVTKIQER